MHLIRSASVRNLFGYVDHAFDLDGDEPTILTAPNGAGKSHLMQIITAALNFDFLILKDEPFEMALVTLESGTEIKVSKTQDQVGRSCFELSLSDRNDNKFENFSIPSEDLEVPLERDDGSPLVRRISYCEWIIRRNGMPAPLDYVEMRSKNVTSELMERVRNLNRVRTEFNVPPAVFIDTKRLDDSDLKYWEPRENASMGRRQQSAASRIQQYISQLRRAITTARHETLAASQRADLTMPERLMAAADARVNEKPLRIRYEKASLNQASLAKNALAIDDPTIPFPDKTTPTTRRFLSVFLADWENRLEPLMPVNAKIDSLREILDEKLEPSGKRTSMTDRGELNFVSALGRKVQVSNLSSGEQHLVALFTSLLFATKEGSFVCVDEPELSLHAAWKHSFVSDISTVARLSELQVLLATHSTGIVNGRWDLTRALELTAPPANVLGDDSGDEILLENDDEF